MKVSNQVNIHNINRTSNHEIILCSNNNKEVKFSYLPKDKVSVAIRNKEGTYNDIKQENLPKELDGLTSLEKFGAFLKSAYVKVSVMSDDESKIYISQKGLGGMWKGDSNGNRYNNFKNNNNYQGHLADGSFNQVGNNFLNQGIGSWKAGRASISSESVVKSTPNEKVNVTLLLQDEVSIPKKIYNLEDENKTDRSNALEGTSKNQDHIGESTGGEEVVHN